VSPFDTAWSLIKAPMWYGDDEEKPPANPRYDMLEHMSWGLDPNSWQQAWESEDGLARAIVKPDHNEGNWLISHYEIQDNEFAQGHGRGTQYLGELIDTLREDENPHGDFENPYDVHVTHVDPPAIGFWEKMVDRGVIDGAHETAWVRKTPDGEEHFTHPYNHESKKPYKPQMIAKNDRTMDVWRQRILGMGLGNTPYDFLERDSSSVQNWKGDRGGKLDMGANRYALVGDETVEKIPNTYGRGQDKSSLAMINALASLGYPIAPETPIGTDNPRFFPTEQTKVDQSFKEYDEGLESNDSRFHREPSKEHKKFYKDLLDLDFEVAQESKLGRALDVGDIYENEDNVGYKDGKLMAIDPYIGHGHDLNRFGQDLSQMAGPISSKNTIYQNRKSPKRDSAYGSTDRREYKNHELAQRFKEVDPMQLDSFTQLYHDREQFKPWDAVEEQLFSDPQSFGQYAPNERQMQQLTEHMDKDNQRYKNVGAALDWMNTPPEQKRLFEFGDDAHARRYRNMLASLNY
jgi:GNAT superfamily N-acetyltransferase